MLFSALPEAQGLYDPRNESDSCGVAMVADIQGRRSHQIVADGLTALEHLEHRGAAGAEPNSGDGAGILLQLPVELLREVVEFDLPAPTANGCSTFAAGICFLPQDPVARVAAVDRVQAIADEEGLQVLGWRAVPVDPSGAEVGATALGCMPHMSMLFVAAPERNGSRPGGIDLDRLVYPVRKRAEQGDVYFPSLSSRTLAYKGMLTTMQLPKYFADLRDERCMSAIAIVHSRFSTNTFPSWPLAHPFRFVAHNGEINTVRGNRNRMHAREAMLASAKIPGDLSRLSPICTPDASDSASFDQVLELLHLGGRSLPHAVMMMIPEAWENNSTLDPARRAFCQYHASLMEPWDGPACVTFTDGTVVGAVLDRNGLRPGRWWRTIDDRVILASESGVLDIPPGEVVAKGRLEPGKMFLIDTAAGRIISDDEIKGQLAAEHPYGEWLHAGLLDIATLPARTRVSPNHESVVRRQIAFGYTEEDLRIMLTPMAASGQEPLGSMGTDTPVAVLSQRPKLIYDYFVELFAQVTNPPLDAIREEIVTSLARVMGPEQNLLEPTAASCRQILVHWPVLDNDELNRIVHINDDGEQPGLKTAVLKALYEVERGGEGLAEAIEELRHRATEAIAKGARTLVISDRDSDHTRAPIPSLLAVAAVHHHLVRTKQRTMVALVVESGDAREVHHIALLIGYGAAAVNPYLAFESIEDLIREGELTGIDAGAAVRNYLKALGKGVMKVMSKMGISTVGSYTAAQAFEAVGLSTDVVDEYLTGTVSQLGGVGLDVLAEEVKQRHRRAYPENPTERVHRRLEVGGEYQFRREGELHLFTPETVFLLQHSTRTGRNEVFAKYSDEVNRLSQEGGTLRGLFSFKKGLRAPIPLHEVESVDAICSRFNTGAMSYGSISQEAHETMAIAMNNIGGRSNSGEGGEDEDRLYDPRRRSAVKQVASGRFGVTSDYLVNATDIQIKMAQGAKPGEGGQLPGFKVYPNIAKTRHSTPGVGLISPPPHHDIYSIEDLAQLIHDLKNANSEARIHVKLVSSVGVGTVAAGVSKAHADVVLISGYDGGTGAAPLTSLKHAGAPWEIGLADTQQTLVLNGLRDRITVQCDGGLRTARDVMVAALLGAEEFGFSTAPLIVAGCIMMRVCHLDTCPVGVATQNPELRARFNGKPEFVENFFRFIAEDVRTMLAELGFRSIDEAVGHAELLDTADGVAHWKAKGLDLSPIFAVPTDAHGGPLPQRRRLRDQEHGLEHALDQTLMALAEGALEDAHAVRLELPVRNVNRTVGTLLGSEVTRRYGAAGLPDDTIHITLTGSAGQSIGAFLPPGITLDLIGDANDYVGKGLSGGRVIVRPPDDVLFLPEDNVIAGNTLLYGATSGEVFLRGRVGERFAARNSGALAVTEGVGDHACEYMTGGRVVVLGRTGRNMAAGMSGGIAYVLGLNPAKVNTAMVELQSLDPDDLEWLHDVVARHVHHTGSTLAKSVLSDWPRRSAQFTKIMPTDYQKVLEATRMAKAEGRDVDTAIMEATRG
ncbi:glutamate synthase domain-containing protein 2/glutamate synthase domain-containing protein 1/glutamate synthase domain-containing protein 3 [Mycolicibacterium sp. BK556]|uniref:glutamate synthase large subunit n=1 Tax=Mycobacteriaceae TaxID=1762 RepID=UPI00105DF671|nr:MULTISPECIES: glutamate synthase large subunit [Mycobacteriaceae]MBB3606807.1 glutamate synthase domain-containing protein 2/glutamate synthase domain-containing protein 1/glutamate synthase domain-containing protein 3 [Mycolicibacterium sp. BK556]MBB3636527.1 glutamate synthase domain-containing protein 2/glutamate synthase domain-containing protein 1/glutamate synthase domain-containing protein 3 [Mycolicibacterium sp. BK607]TDO16967.1 glutamate synthase (NADH) large subunit [Mycobacterium 